MKFLLLGVFLIPLVFNPWAGNEMYETAKQSWFFIFLAFCLGYFAFALFRRKKIEIPFEKGVFIFALLWIISFALSTIFSKAPIESFWGSYKRGGGFLTAAALLVFFFICLSLFRKEKFRKAFFGITVGSGLVVSIFAILQYFGIDPFLKGPSGIFAGRTVGTLGNPSSLGQFLIFPWWVCLISLLAAYRANQKKSLFFWLAALAIITFGLVSSFNRASILGIGLAAALFLFYKLPSRRWRAIFISIFIIAGLAAGLALFKAGPESRLASVRSLGSRSVLWSSAAQIVPKYFWVGGGPETTYQTIQETLSPELYRYERMLDSPDRIHNVLLETLLTRGIAGLLVLMGMVFFIAKSAYKNLNSLYSEASFFALCACFIALQFGFAVITHMVFLTAFSAIFLLQTLRFSTWKWRLPLFLKIIPSALGIVIAVALGIYGYQLTASEITLGKGLKAFFRSDPAASAIFEKAQKPLPYFREIPYMTFSLFLKDIQKNPEILRIVKTSQKVVARVSADSFYSHIMKGELAYEQRDNRLGATEFEKASRLAPNWPGVWYKWGRGARAAGDKKLAKEKLEKFLSFAPKYAPLEIEAKRIFTISNPAYFEVKEFLFRANFKNRF